MLQTINDVHQQFAGFFPDAALRPFAALVSRRLSEGHICLDLNEDLEGLRPEALNDMPMIGRDGQRQPFILHLNKMYLERYFHYETRIINRLLAFLENGKKNFADRAAALQNQQTLLQSLFPPTGQTDWQLIAAICGVMNDFTIITGGPGTGKTTTVARLLALLYAMDASIKVALAAPTGKAAMRMAESLSGQFPKLQPLTVHRLLGYKPDSPYFRHNAANPLPHQVVIVDEASMLDAALFAKLLDAIAPDARLILLGDKDQLASVEAGSLLGDLCQLDNTVNRFRPEITALLTQMGCIMPQDRISESLLSGNIIELMVSRRFSEHEGIGQFSRAVINSDIDQLQKMMAQSGNERVLIDETYDEKIFEEFVLNFRTYIEEKDIASALKKFNQARVLCAIRGGEQGVLRVNRRIEDVLRANRLLIPAGEFYPNRPVMVTGNNYELGLFNGDIGIVRFDGQGVLKVWFEDGKGGVRELLPALMPEVETVFAMTVHKSQGSEYDQVLVLLPKAADERLMTRELLYTAITRAKSNVLLQATADIITKTASASVKRASGIKERLKNLQNGISA